MVPRYSYRQQKIRIVSKSTGVSGSGSDDHWRGRFRNPPALTSYTVSVSFILFFYANALYHHLERRECQDQQQRHFISNNQKTEKSQYTYIEKKL
jgi:hypothetical protein